MTARLALALGLSRARQRARKGPSAYLDAFAKRCGLRAADVVRLLRVRRAPSRATRIAIERATSRWPGGAVMAASWSAR